MGNYRVLLPFKGVGLYLYIGSLKATVGLVL
jgi:hypothetical protein